MANSAKVSSVKRPDPVSVSQVGQEPFVVLVPIAVAVALRLVSELLDRTQQFALDGVRLAATWHMGLPDHASISGIGRIHGGTVQPGHWRHAGSL
ncbi:hypothetical protein AB0C28_22430 [Nonomuraea sp. NPDC048892]|uniref:hypothetical protein n=1 Tax=Nonomuraea sp. NPDC048892 TaxID=3154624 RepID=UPI0033C96057